MHAKSMKKPMKLNAIANRPFWLMLGWLLLAMPAHAFYDPSLGRWLNRDPIGERGGQNLYQFVHNDPVRHLDDDGLFVIAIPAMLAGGEGLGVFLGGCAAATATGYGIGVLATLPGQPGAPPSVPSITYPGANTGIGVNAPPTSICRPYPPPICITRTKEEEAKRKACVQACHDQHDDAWELSFCIRRCNGGWGEDKPTPPRPRWPEGGY